MTKKQSLNIFPHSTAVLCTDGQNSAPAPSKTPLAQAEDLVSPLPCPGSHGAPLVTSAQGTAGEFCKGRAQAAVCTPHSPNAKAAASGVNCTGTNCWPNTV